MFFLWQKPIRVNTLKARFQSWFIIQRIHMYVSKFWCSFQFCPRRRMNWVGSCVHRALRTKVELERSCKLLGKLSASLHSKGLFKLLITCDWFGNSSSSSSFGWLIRFSLQAGAARSAGPSVPGGGDVSLPSHFWHVADGEQDGAVTDRVQRSSALDEGRFSGAGPRHTQADGEVP